MTDEADTTSERTFLRALYVDPRDDTCRLVYADWLAEQHRERDECEMRIIAEPHVDAHRERWAGTLGDEACPSCKGTIYLEYQDTIYDVEVRETCHNCKGTGRVPSKRGEFVRVQVELAQIPDPPPESSIGMRSASREQRLSALMEWKRVHNATYHRLKARERELLPFGHVNCGELVAMIPADPRSLPWFRGAESVINAKYTRGFPSVVTCDTASFLRHAATLGGMPLDRVALSNVPEPLHVTTRTELGNWWTLAQRDIPPEIWTFMTGEWDGGPWRRYATREDAANDLSVAAITHCRKQWAASKLPREDGLLSSAFGRAVFALHGLDAGGAGNAGGGER